MTISIKPRSRKDAEALKAFVKAIETTPALIATISRDLAEETVDIIHQEFRKETDPYGDRWAPKQADDGRKVLSGKTSRLKNGWHVASLSIRGYTVAPSVNYADPHQNPRKGRNGRLKRPRRMMVPKRGQLPDAWQTAFEQVISDRMALHFSTSRARRSRNVLRRIAKSVI